jgi:hypothetical protein
MIPHPATLTALASHRRAEHLAEADRYRLAQRAAGEGGAHHRQRPDWTALAAVALALVLPFMASLFG